MTKNAYIEKEIMQIRSQGGHLFAVCFFTAKWDSFSLFSIYLDTHSIIILLVHFDLIYIYYVHIKYLVIQNYILVKVIMLFNV